MFGTPFYFSLIRKYVILVGTLFNNIKITRTDKDGNVTSLLKVPITYAPKDKMLARVIQDPNLDRPSATAPLPMISFEMGKMSYDGTRKLNTIGKVAVKNATNADKFKYQYNPVPYNIEFKVYVYAKNVEDATKIIEQVLPYFTPDWTTTVNLISEVEVTMDIPVILTNINYSDNYSSDFKEHRAIVWELNLLLKGYFYGPVKSGGVIKFINVDFYIPNTPDGLIQTAVGNTAIAEKITIQPGLDANSNPVEYYGNPYTNTGIEVTTAKGALPYSQIEVDDDFGFITQIYDTDQIT